MRDLVLRVTYENVVTDLDIDSNIPLRLDISAFDNSRIGVLFGVGSQTFDLPGTKKNNIFFRQAYDVGATDIPALYDFVSAAVLLDGDELLAGNLQLLEVVTSEDGFVTYKVTVVDQAVGFTSNLDGAFVVNADFTDLNHNLTVALITGSWSGSANNADLPLDGAVYYPLVDYGNDGQEAYYSLDNEGSLPFVQFSGIATTSGSIDNQRTPLAYQQLLPAIRGKELLDIMCDQAGFTYTSSFANLTTEAFKNVYVLAKSQDGLGPTSAGASNEQFSGSNSSTQLIDNVGGAYPNPLQTTAVLSPDFDPSSNWTGSPNFRYVCPLNGNYSVEFTMNMQVHVPVFKAQYLAGIFVRFAGGGTQRYSTTGTSGFYNAGTSNETQTAAFNIPNLSQGDSLELVLYIENLSSTVITDAEILVGTTMNVTSTPTSFENSPIDMSQQFDGNTKTLDLFKGFLEQFNMVAFPTPNQNQSITIEPFDTWMLSGREVDWTNKFNTAKRIGITTPIAEQAKETFIGNSGDKSRFDVVTQDNQPNLPFGTVQLVSNSTVPQGTRKITTFFSPVVMGTMLASGSVTVDGLPTYNLSVEENYVPHLYKFDNSGLKSFNFKPRIGYKLTDNPLTSAANGTMFIGNPGIGAIAYSGSEGYATISNISAVGNLENTFNLHFDNTYTPFVASNSSFGIGTAVAQTSYESYWANYIAGLYWNEGKKVTLDLYFTPEEYKDIRLNDKVTIKDQQYRINKIKGFNLQEPDVVTVELIKLYPVFNDVTTTAAPTPSPTPAPTPSPSPTPTPVPTPTPTPTPSPTTCRDVTFFASGGSGGFVEFSFVCCDGSTDIIQESDYGSSTACVQVSTIVQTSGNGGYTVGGTCTTAC
tara:strand:+ start:398 stop:3004 length:2607 start_codon:yes stop_codon:yes gene_type:complete